MTGTPDERIEEAKETLDLLRRVHPGSAPAPETIAEFHELHAVHERKRGRLDRAEQALQRAERARSRS